MITQTQQFPKDGDVLKKEGEAEGLIGNRCYRCGEDPEKAHKGGFCPAFASYSEAGQWLQFSSILRVLRRHAKGSLSAWTTNKVEEHEGPFGHNHSVVGLAYNNKYLGRFDCPNVPEFSLWESGNSEYGIPVSSSHSMLYKGWRRSLRQTAQKIGADWRKVTRELGISPDISTEHLKRQKSSWL